MRNSAILLLLPWIALAQDTVAPTTGVTVGPPRGEDKGAYNVVQSWEVGYRYATVGGDEGKYRSDVNYGNGVRLLSSFLTVNSKDGHGHWFDEIVLTTQGLGNDPYESATVRVQKNRLYRYDMQWRQNDYYNPGLTVANGEHLMDTTYRWQDHEFTLFPQSWIRARGGYSRNVQDGPALTTAQEFDSRGDVFPLFRDLKQEYNEYRLGMDVTLKGFRLTILRRWEYFKEDTTDQLKTPLAGANVPFGSQDPSTLTSFYRAEPTRGNTPGWMGNLLFERKLIAVNARMTYAGGRGTFIQNESALGIDRFGTSQNRQIVVTGDGTRPVTAGDLNLTLLPESRLSIINSTSVSNTRITGNNLYTQFDNATQSAENVNFQFLGMRLITNATDVRYRFTKTFDAFAGYRYSDRQIRSTEDQTTPGVPFNDFSAEQVNLLHAGVVGLNWVPLKDLRFHAEAEIGGNNHPFTPISLGNYHAIRSTVRYRKRNYSLSAGYQENYNNNSIVITAYSARSRSYNADGSWSAKPWLTLDASYSKLHLDTLGGIAFFAGSPRPTLITNQESLYISNIHAANFSARIPVKSRADIYIGYNITKDTGDGRSSLATQPDAVTQLLYNVQTFPLTYQTPYVRISVKLNGKLRYNLGYQYYGYHEDFGVLSESQNYRAHTGYTSLLWSF
jgi:hypothetical protein